MTTSATAVLFGNGQIHIPQDILETLHWHEGVELKLTATGQGVLLEAKSNRRGKRLEDLIGMLQHDGPPIPIEELCIMHTFDKNFCKAARATGKV